MEVNMPAPEPPDVDGELTIQVPGFIGAIQFDGASDVLSVTDFGLGDMPTTVTVNDDPIIAVNLNAEHSRKGSITASGSANENFSISVSQVLDARVTFSMTHIREVFDDPPKFLMDETIGIRLDGSDSPTIKTLEAGDKKDMQVSSGRLTLSSTAMAEDVVFEEGMCMGSKSDEGLTDEERDQRHDLFGDLAAEMCGG